MLYNNRNYPHPVLGIGDDYISSAISVELSISSDSKYIELRPIFIHDNREISTLLETEKANYVTHVYCRGTMYRDVFKSEKKLANAIQISSDKLNGEVEVDFFICSACTETEYASDSFNSEYGKTKFKFEKSDIIAYAGKGKFFANKSPEELKAISTIMNVVCTEKKDKPMFLDFTGNKIALMLCVEDYNNYKLLKSNSENWGIILGSIVLPALIESLYFIDSEESGEFIEKPWYKILSEIKAKSKDQNPLVLAQNILEKPIRRCLDSITNISEYE